MWEKYEGVFIYYCEIAKHEGTIKHNSLNK